MAAVAPGFFQGKRLAVFGAGYVGGEVAALVAAQGGLVTALTRNVAKASALAAAGCDVVIDDLVLESWHAKVPPADLVLNCISSGGGGVEGYRRNYVEGMRSILTWARKHPAVETFVYTSSTSVYPQSGGVWIDESAETAEAIGTPAILIEAENLLRAPASHAICKRWFVLRLAGIYGPGRHHLLDQLRNEETEIAGSGDHHLNLAHRDDIAAAILAAFQAPKNVADEIFNVADDAPAKKAEVVTWLARQIGFPPPTFSGEASPGRRASALDRRIANGKIKAKLGWTPRHADFRSGYRALLEA